MQEAPPSPRDDINFSMAPETTFVTPQNTEGSTDGHRWQQFGILPDRWKNNLFNYEGDEALGMARCLYVDLNDRRGNERAFVSIADTTGATSVAHRGAHNGWRAPGGASPLVDATGAAIDISTNPAIARYDHGGQPGSTWDMYGVKASEALTTSGAQLGCREGPKADGLATNKDAKSGPTADMLGTYYDVLIILTGDLNSGILGPFTNRGSNDVALLEQFMTVPAPGQNASTLKRGIYIAGDGFLQSEIVAGE